MKNISIFLIIICLSISCTKKFVTENQNPNNISNEMLQQDYNLVGSSFSGLLYNLCGSQIDENLVQDCYARHLACPEPYIGGVNNTTYYITWNSYWDDIYGGVMAPTKKLIQLSKENNLPLYATWAKFIRILAMSKLTTFHGPVIYSKYGTAVSSVPYDKESDLYNLFFLQLDTIQTEFTANKDYKAFARFDPSYKGDMTKWIKLVNSMRLRLAIRLSKVAPAIAKTQGEKALADPGGLIVSNGDNFRISLLGNILPIAMICFEWDDTSMDAAMESFLVGLKDGRIGQLFSPAADNTLYPEHPDYPYKGVRSGAFLATKDQRVPYSKIAESFKTVTSRRYMTAAEVHFLRAEASLRGWNGAGDAKTNYENGVKSSFEDWGATGVDAYLANSTNKPIDYIDPLEVRNSFNTRSSITVAWNEADGKELKLEKILTQKWIDGVSNSLEAWVDFRRTGYPKLPYNARNDSNVEWGIIASDDFIKRMPFTNGERSGNAKAVAEATTYLGGPDKISTRLWWDTGGPNF